MRCSACSTENPPHAKFCLECGVPMAQRCSGCGTVLPDAAKFCLECGQPIPAAGAAPTASTAPQTYTPRHLAEKILAGRDALSGERKQVTVLFADVVGSTELIRDRDPEDAQRLLDAAVQRMMRAVHRYEGTVSRLQGDGLIALFGAPIAHEDHAVRACYAALAMLEAVQDYAEEARRTHGAAIEIRVGLNSGEVIVRLISDDLHMDYTALGETVHLASRLEGLADAGAGLLSDATLALVEGFVEVRPRGPMSVKGLEQPITVYELVGVGAARTRLQAAVARGLTPFVGRDDERAAIDRALARAQAGQGQVVALVGEPGVGKSRLVYEVSHRAGADGWTILESGTASYGMTVPYLPVIDLVKGYCRIESADDTQAIAEKVAERLLALDQTLQPVVPALQALLEVPVEDAAWQTLDPPGRRRATLDAIKRLLLCESRERPLVLVVEDLHWMDSETQALLDGLVESLPTAAMLMLVTYRPEYAHGWGNRSSYTQVRIDPLQPAGADDLLGALLGDDPALQPLKQHLIARTEGNPLFLEESIRSLVETDVLVGRRGAYILTRDVPEIRVPATVQAVLAARIDRLPAGDKQLLQAASVVGKDVPFVLLQAISDTPDAELQTGLDRLQAAEMLYPINLFPELEYTFKHALTHEVAYGSLLQDRRRALHARIVEAIEAIYRDRLDEQVERLAHHALRGQVWEKAVSYCRQAGQRAGARSANREAVTYFEQSLDALTHLPDRRDVQEVSIDVRLDMRNGLIPLNEFGTMFERLKEAEALAVALDDQHRLGWVSAYLTACYFNANMPSEAEQSGQRALAIANELQDSPLLVMSHFFVGLTYLYVCRYRDAIEALQWNVETLVGDPLWDRLGEPGLPAVFSRSYLLRALAEVGELDEGIIRGEEAIRFSEIADIPFSLGSALEGLGYVYLRRGDVPTAITLLERGLRICEEWQFNLIQVPIEAYLGHAYALAGRHNEALQLLESADTVEGGLHPSQRATFLGDVYLRAGGADRARECAQRALALAEVTDERGNRGWAIRLLAEIAARREPPDTDEAETRYRAALALAEGLGMRPLQAHCHLGLGELYRMVGRQDEARAELSTAITMLREMGMTFWLPEAEAELAAITSPPSAERVG
jgi:class 3 adenylate cyclase/tetratricopeptide (TPR) repeat protein